jgi:hypothetical protein
MFRKNNEKYLIQFTQLRHKLPPVKSFYGGFDGELCYDFVPRKKAVVFDSKRKAKKSLKELQKNCTFYENDILDIVKRKY